MNTPETLLIFLVGYLLGYCVSKPPIIRWTQEGKDTCWQLKHSVSYDVINKIETTIKETDK